MNESATMHTGPLGSTVHVLRTDPATVAALAALDWSRFFRRSAWTRCEGSSPRRRPRARTKT